MGPLDDVRWGVTFLTFLVPHARAGDVASSC